MKNSMEHWWDNFDRGMWQLGKESLPSATLPITNPIRTALGLKPGHHVKDANFTESIFQ
jgi:hypothetical protein